MTTAPGRVIKKKNMKKLVRLGLIVVVAKKLSVVRGGENEVCVL